MFETLGFIVLMGLAIVLFVLFALLIWTIVKYIKEDFDE